MASNDRPLSPHLQIYRWQWTMALSILHRATGVALSAGAVLLAGWLMTLAMGSAEFDILMGILTSIPGQICMIGWTWSIFYHLGSGIRHLFWDAGKGYSLPVAQISGYVVVGQSIVLTAAVWFGWLGALV
ncbi:MAG TPA: succinate dehydrogenase, cytochrome b556 subunit [Rhodospirillaceae bacterium]|nr:succinate dehydrogenase, cytochrome b556 subunit [Rhodospirillaceae bacterium]HAA92784.1 succinate dehydrogenase, cytochrome b556 subunit [Rhodospirillaceae bacterium]HAT35208.1 succinate dehydrogenase, cytochrome b556 subunit [Rhodospirillaceae bacterium]|tara:strand:+ start:640 stop:1029 length:390 start_codon:yes stop_codon:yes gene_type:complete